MSDVEAEFAIRRVLMRYCRAIDRMDEPLLRSCYHPDATEDHAGFRGGVDDYVTWVWALLGKFTMTMHVVANVLVEPDGPDAARAESYGVAYHRDERSPDNPRRNYSSGFRYLDRFERRDGDWRIASRLVAVEWSRVEGGFIDLPPGITRGARGGADPLYERRG
ncbi:nuclear transport factor 2 family protein [Dactylosporangium sp. CA-092794]|uniref:nuclear transport factor 2 family protein n=1 Tax=Dactylosporangium sp. CA-092794 TaxID=3239929 RepID=UPI003D917B6C